MRRAHVDFYDFLMQFDSIKTSEGYQGGGARGLEILFQAIP